MGAGAASAGPPQAAAHPLGGWRWYPDAGCTNHPRHSMQTARASIACKSPTGPMFSAVFALTLT